MGSAASREAETRDGESLRGVIERLVHTEPPAGRDSPPSPAPCSHWISNRHGGRNGSRGSTGATGFPAAKEVRIPAAEIEREPMVSGRPIPVIGTILAAPRSLLLRPS